MNLVNSLVVTISILTAFIACNPRNVSKSPDAIISPVPVIETPTPQVRAPISSEHLKEYNLKLLQQSEENTAILGQDLVLIQTRRVEAVLETISVLNAKNETVALTDLIDMKNFIFLMEKSFVNSNSLQVRVFSDLEINEILRTLNTAISK